MKSTFLLTFCILVLFSVSHAQIDKGRIQIGGSLGFNHSKSENNKSNIITVNPAVGRFYSTNHLVGVSLIYSYSEQKVSNLPLGPSNGIGASVYLRQYKPLVKSFYFFTEESFGGLYTHATNLPSKINTINVNAAFTPGLAYDLTQKMQLELSLNQIASVNYIHQNTSGTVPSSSSFSINSSLGGSALSNIFIGIRFYL